MTPLKTLLCIVLLFAIMYLGLTLYFEHRLSRLEKEYQKRYGKKENTRSAEKGTR